MDRVWRARILAAIAFLGAGTLVWLSLWGPAIAAFTMGAAALLLITDREMPAKLPDAGVAGTTRALAGITRELHLQGRGTILPPREGERSSVLFIAAAEGGSVPAMAHGEVALHTSGARGVQLPPPGTALEREVEKLAGLPTGAGAEEAVVHIQRAFRALDLGRDVRIARAGDAFRVSYEPIAFADVCRATREELAPWHEQGGCPTCSLAAILLSRAHARPVHIKGAGSEGTRVYLDLEVVR